MRVTNTWIEGALTLRFRLDAEEHLTGIGQDRVPIRLVTNEASIRHHAVSSEAHPDLVALAILTIVVPWTTRRVNLDLPVSRGFSEAVRAAFDIDIGPVDNTIEPRNPGDRIGLLYSGGMDSGALLGFVPPDAPLVNLRRVRHPRIPNRATHLRVDVSEHYARLMDRPGRDFEVVSTDLEFLCQPFPTYPTWPATGIGAVLLGDYLGMVPLPRGWCWGRDT